MDAEEDAAGDGDRPGEPAAADQPRRVRRRRPAHAERDLHPGRADLPRPHPAVGRRHPDDRARVRQLHRRRRLRARHVRPRRDGRRRREGLPRRPAAGEDGHRRGAPTRRSSAAPTMHGRVSGLADYFAVDELDALRIGRRIVRPAQLAQARAGAAAPAVPPRYDAEELLGIVGADLSRPFDPREVLARIVDDSDFDEFKPRYGPSAGHRLGADPRLSGRRPRQRAGRAVQRGGAEGGAVHPARQPDRHPAGLPAEHHRLHGRQGVRAGRDHQARREDDQRRLQLPGPAPVGAARRLLRRRQLRHVRPGVRPALPVRLAEGQVGGDGPGAARRRAVDRRPRGRRGPGDAVRRGGRRRHAGRRRGADRGGVAAGVPVRPGLRRRDHRPPRHPHRARPLPLGDRTTARSRASAPAAETPASASSGCERTR